MKTKPIVGLLLALFLSAQISAQNFTQPEKGKAVVYVVNVMTGLGTKTTPIFDSETCIAELGFRSYLRYECEPGEHIFGAIPTAKWSFFTADLEADRIYVVQMRTESGLGGPMAVFKSVDKAYLQKKGIIGQIVHEKAPVPAESKMITKYNTKLSKNTVRALDRFNDSQRAKNKHLHIAAEMYLEL